MSPTFPVLIALLAGGCVLDRTGQSATEAYRRELLVQASRLDNLDSLMDKADARLSQLEEVTRARGQEEILKMESMDQIRQEVSRLRGDLEVLSHNVDQSGTTAKSSAEDAQFRLAWLELRAEQVEKSLGLKAPPPPKLDAAAAVEGAGAGGALNAAQGAVEAAAGGGAEGGATAVEGVSTAPVEELPADADGLMKLAEEHLAAGRNPAAEAVLNRFLKEFPENARVPEAKYRLAEAAFNAKDFTGAVLRFQAVIDQHRDSAWAPWAMLRQGECFDAQGQAANAKLFYEDTIRLYPKSKAAKEAKQKLGK